MRTIDIVLAFSLLAIGCSPTPGNVMLRQMMCDKDAGGGTSDRPEPGCTVHGKRLALSDLGAKDSGTVDEITQAMRDLGFAEIHGVACGERVTKDVRIVRLDGQDYQWKAIVYRSRQFKDRVVARALSRTDGTPASRAEEFRLFLSGQIPLAYHAGGWLPVRRFGPTSELQFDGQVEDICEMKSGAVVKHVRPASGASPFFAVVHDRTIATERIEDRIVQGAVSMHESEPERDGGRTIWTLPTEKELRKAKLIAPDQNVLKVVGIEEVEDMEGRTIGEVSYRTRIVKVAVPAEKRIITGTIYPYGD